MNDTVKVAPYGKCPKCGREVQLKEDGTLKSHGTITLGGRHPYRPCKGSFKAPVPAPAVSVAVAVAEDE